MRKVLIIDDDPKVTARIRMLLSSIRDFDDFIYLELHSQSVAHGVLDYGGVHVDYAFVDLRFAEMSDPRENYDGFAVVSKIRKRNSGALIFGYSSVFASKEQTPEILELKRRFMESGADVVLTSNELSATTPEKLRERLLQVPAVKAGPRPRVFICSASEGLDIASDIQHHLSNSKLCEPTVWNGGWFDAGGITILKLLNAAETFQYAVLVFTPTDTITTARGDTKRVARDNVVFEAGLFIGALGRDRALIVMPDDHSVSLPSDLEGLTAARFDASAQCRDDAIAVVCTKLLKAMKLRS